MTPIVIDSEGDRSPFLITNLERTSLGDKYYYFNASDGTIKENIYELAAVSPLWFDRLARVFVELGYYGDIGLGNLRQLFMDVNGAAEFKRRGGWATLDETLEFMKERLSNSSGKKAQYLETVIERFNNWIPAIAPVFRFRSGYPWDALKGHLLIYNIQNMTLDGQLFYQNYLLAKLLFIQEKVTFGTDLVFYDLDEYTKFQQSAANKQSQYIPLIDETTQRARKRGLFISYKSQRYLNISPEIIANSNNIYIFRLRHQKCLQTIGEELNLNSDQTPHLAKLEDQECVFINKGMKEPQLARIEDVDFSGFLSHDEINELNKHKLEKLPSQSAVTPEPAPLTRTPEPVGIYKKVGLAAAEDTSKGIDLGTTAKRIGEDSKKFYQAFADLVKQQFFTVIQEFSFGRPGKRRYSEITERGAKRFSLDYDKFRLLHGMNKSIKARVMTTIVAEWLERDGRDWKSEYHGADLWSIRGDGSLQIYEIETLPHEHHVAVNIRRDIKTFNPDSVCIIVDSSGDVVTARETIRTRLTPDELAKTKIIQIKEYMT